MTALIVGALVGAMVVVSLLVALPAVVVAGRASRSAPSVPDGPLTVGFGDGVPIIADPDPIVSDASFAPVYAYLAEQRREGSR